MPSAEFNESNISKMIELNRKVSELSFKRDYLIWKNSSNASLISSLSSELSCTELKLNELKEKFSDFKIIFPNQNKLDELNNIYRSLSKDEIYNSVRSKSGENLELIKERAHILKSIFDNRFEIAKLNVLLNSVKIEHEKKNALILVLCENKSIDESSFADVFSQIDENKLQLLKMLSRVGVGVNLPNFNSKEKKVSLGSEIIWVPVDSAKNVELLDKTLSTLIQKIQYINAQRQIKTFSNEEDEEFSSIQLKYLSAIKEKDELLSKFKSKI